VQSPGKIALWETDPWTPTKLSKPEIGGNRLYGRGTADDKAGVIGQLAGIESILKTAGALPVNVKVIFEGEEEIGSENLETYLKENFDLLKADIIVLADTGNFKLHVPSITYSLRGLVGVIATVKTVEVSVHSGQWGGPVIDPVAALCKVIATLHDKNGNLMVPGIYDGLRTPSAEDVNNIKKLDYTEATFRKESGLLDSVIVAGDPQKQTLEKLWFGPSITINGFDAQPTAGASNTILGSAAASFSVRIAANQDPVHILDVLKKHLTANVPYGAQITFSNEQTTKPFLGNPKADVFQATKQALSDGYGKPSNFVGSGGTIGFVDTFVTAFGAPAIMIGVEDPHSNGHAENESLLLPDWASAIRSVVYLLYELQRK